MRILAIIGSASQQSSNEKLLCAIQNEFSGVDEIEIYSGIRNFPIFTPEKLNDTIPSEIHAFKQKVTATDAIIICTPEYTHNIPAVLKNMIDWCTASGEFYQKKVLPITFTPNPPRGEHAMTSLIQSLKALDMKIVTQLPLHKTDVIIKNDKIEIPREIKIMLEEALNLLK